MVTQYAIVCDGVVDNVVLWDGEADWTPPQGCDLIALTDDQAVGPGDTYDGQAFTPAADAPTAPVPVAVDPQALTDLSDAAKKATTAAATRSVLLALIDQLTPSDVRQ